MIEIIKLLTADSTMSLLFRIFQTDQTLAKTHSSSGDFNFVVNIIDHSNDFNPMGLEQMYFC